MGGGLRRTNYPELPSEGCSRVGTYPVEYRVGSYPVSYRVGALVAKACDRRHRARGRPSQALPGRWLPCSGSRVGTYPVRYRVTNVQDGRWIVWVLTVIGRKRTQNLFAESPNAHQSPPRRVWRPSGVGGYVRGEPLGPPAPWVKCSGRSWRWTSRYGALGSPGHEHFRARRGRYVPLGNLGRGPGSGTG